MRVPWLLFVLALAARVAAAAHYPDPAYPDAYYYTLVARSLALGRGFHVDFVWVFAEVGNRIPALPELPIPSNAHWMPLASILAAPFVALLGPTPIAALASYAIVGALAAPLTWAIARDVGAPGWMAVGAGLIVAVPGVMMPLMAQPDNYSVYPPLLAASLWFGGRGLRGSSRWFVLAGPMAGLAALSRPDGVLVLVALGLVFLWDRVRTPDRAGARPAPISVGAALACLALFLLVIAPWWWRQLHVFGTIWPWRATGKVLYLREFSEWNSITTPATLEWLLGQGLGPLLLSRARGLWAALDTYAVLGCSVVLAPLAMVGLWVRRRSADFFPFLLYAGLLLAANTVLFAVHVTQGTFLHSAVGLLPHTAILALEGAGAVAAWVAARRPRLRAEPLAKGLGLATVALVLLLAVPATLMLHASWDTRRRDHRAVATALRQARSAPDDRILSIDASGTKYWTGLGGVVTPDDPLETIEQVARAYGIRWLAVVRGYAARSLIPVLDGTRRVAWIGPPVYAVDPSGTPVVDPMRQPASRPSVRVALFPVCVAESDGRCASPIARALR